MPNPTCGPCATASFSWWSDGGFAEGAASPSTLSGCNLFVQRRQSASVSLECSDALSCYPMGRLTAADVSAAVQNPDVQKAMNAGGMFYGSDPRGCDGTVLMITFGNGAPITIGESCSQSGSCGPVQPCVPIPPGLDALRNLLQALDAQEVSMASCYPVR